MGQEWFYTANGGRHGPVAVGELAELAENGGLKPTDLVWREGMAGWTPAGSVRELFADGATVASAGGLGLWKVFAGLGVAVALVALLGGAGVIWLGRKTEATDKTNADGNKSESRFTEMTASAILRELREVEERCTKEFGGKSCTISGSAWHLDGDSIYLAAKDKEPGSAVYCEFDKVGQLGWVQNGQPVTVQGNFNYMSAGRTWMKQCTIVGGAGESSIELVRRCNALKEPFEKKYAGKRLRIIGDLKSAGKQADHWDIWFEIDTKSDLRVQCRDKVANDGGLAKLKKGETVTIEGTFKGTKFASFHEIELLDGDLISPRSQSTPVNTDNVRPRPNPPRVDDSTPTAGEVTRANYDRIKEGMLLTEVQRILGPGKEQASGSGGLGTKVAIYAWQDGLRTISVSFLNGRVQTKAQVGL